jgi:hypothetical protein
MKITSLLGGDETSGYTWQQLVTAIYGEVDGMTLLVSNSLSLSEGYHY